MSAHPTAKQIELLVHGGLEDSEATAIRDHLASCADCGAKHNECTANQPWERDLRDAVRDNRTHLWTLASDPPPLPRSQSLNASAIEGYTLRFPELGEGGQGVVYQAVQQFPARKVAIKFLREGSFASTAAQRRFEREIAIAAELKHPNIITIHDSGVMTDGRRFCVMEYIRGLPLTEYVRENRLSLTETLELFTKVCDAVNYAHQKGIIHRDLKPSNILVDAHGNVKVLDFGLARSVVGPADTAVSMTGQVIGAPAYLSPEQTRGNPEEIDVRSDVYTLGVILYELLTGRYPYAVEGEWSDLISRIREVEPTPPCRAWHVDSGVRSRHRRLRRARTRCPIDRDLETIILVCLRKERDRRYQSAGELARDIRRYLAGQTIIVRPDSLWYVLHKKISRHRKLFAGGIVLALVVAVSLVIAVRQRAMVAEQRRALERHEARAIRAAFVGDYGAALALADAAAPEVRKQLLELTRSDIRSEAFTDRIAGARAGLFLASDDFWRSVDDGELWTNGEWLELCDTDDPVIRSRTLALAEEHLSDPYARRKYVAFCLIGQLASEDSNLADVCERAVEKEPHVGVVAAARWAAMRLGRTVSWPQGHERILNDDLSGLVFARIPSCDSFRPGSPPGEPDRYEDETHPGTGVYIRPLFFSLTEVPAASFARFLKAPAGHDWIPGLAATLFPPDSEDPLKAALLRAARPDAEPGALRQALTRLMTARVVEGTRVPVGYVSPDVARRYCLWLNEQAKTATPHRRYRLPTEAEWEYACRAGNEAAFCYGPDARYLPYFADCNGSADFHHAGQHMPNFFGLYDTHGGLWELCDTRYPSELVVSPDDRVKELFVKRGGAFYSPAVRCRSAQRNYIEHSVMDAYTGFRLVIEVEQP